MAKPLRILHYTAGYAPAWSLGGPPRSTSNLCEGLAERGHAVTVFTTKLGLADHADLPDSSPVERKGVTVHYFPLSKGLGIRSSAMESAVKSRLGEFDLLHVTGVWQPTSIAACRAAKSRGIRYLVSPRGALSRYSFGQKPLKKIAYWWMYERRNMNGASSVHYTAGVEQLECARLNIRPPGVVIPNSIDLSAWRPDPAAGNEWRHRHGIATDEFVFLNSGRLHHKKGLDLLMEAAIRLPSSKKWRLVFAGPDEDGTGRVLAQLAAQKGIENRIVFTGVLDTRELAAAYSSAGMFLFPSRNENFGNVAVEALACGTRLTVAPGVGCSHELAGLEGVVVVLRDVDRWHAEMERALQQGKLDGERVKMRRQWLEARYHTAAVAASMEAVYRSVVSPEASP